MSQETKKIRVAICTPCFTGQMPIEVAGKMGVYLYKLGKNHPELEIEWWTISRRFVHTARNMFVEAAEKENIDFIWWVDDDCVLPDDSIDILPRLISHDKDIVITPYFMRHTNEKGSHVCGVLKSKGRLRDVHSYYNIGKDELNKGLIEVDGGGTHCMLQKVSMFNQIPKPYFALPEFGGTEDMYMCLKARECGIKIYCDSDIEAGHVGYAPTITSKDCKDE